MNQTPNLSLECEDKEEELLEYKLEEVKSDWVNDFVKIPKELLNEINDVITDPNAERIPSLEKAVRTLRRLSPRNSLRPVLRFRHNNESRPKVGYERHRYRDKFGIHRDSKKKSRLERGVVWYRVP